MKINSAPVFSSNVNRFNLETFDSSGSSSSTKLIEGASLRTTQTSANYARKSARPQGFDQSGSIENELLVSQLRREIVDLKHKVKALSDPDVQSLNQAYSSAALSAFTSKLQAINLADGIIPIPNTAEFYQWEQEQKERYMVGDKWNEKRAERKTKMFDAESKCIGQLVMQFPKKGIYVGSAALVWVGRGPTRKFFLVTCAHNIMMPSEDQTQPSLRPVKVTFYRGLDEQEYLSVHVSKVYVHPEYEVILQKMDTKETLWQGVDIAICILKDGSELKKLTEDIDLHDFLNLQEPAKTPSVDDDISVTGYPGEKKGVQYTMSGSIKHIKQAEYTQNGLVFTYENIDTTGGQSGSPVTTRGKLVGVHVGWGVLEETYCNLATSLTTSIRDWIKRILRTEFSF